MYTFLVHLYYSIVRVISLRNKKAALFIQGRKNWKTKLHDVASSLPECIWFHCCSLGEFEDGREVMEAIRKNNPQQKILLTFSSPSGFEIRKNYSGADHVLYLPADTTSNANFFLERLKPRCAIFVRNDVWMNYLKQLHKKKIPVFLLSFNMNNSSAFIRFPQKYFYKKAFNYFNKIFVQNETTATLLLAHFNYKKAIDIGNTRINAICNTFSEKHLFPEIEKFVGTDFCIVAGSTLSKDQAIFIATYQQLKKETIKWIIVPHEINEEEISSFIQNDSTMISYSGIEKLTSDGNFLWIDNVGMLSKLYRYADVAFIGGGFNKIGIHSIVEPAIYGCPVAFGPNHRNYSEALDLLASDGAAIISTTDELELFIKKYYLNAPFLSIIQQKNQAYVLSKKAKIEVILKEVEAVLKR
jgi:3-deoxy-D-manno-octulosonic-acid transferase